MKAKITKLDGTVIELDGKVEEVNQVLKEFGQIPEVKLVPYYPVIPQQPQATLLPYYPDTIWPKITWTIVGNNAPGLGSCTSACT